MKRKLLLFSLLLALLVPWAANAQTTVTIGEGTATSNTNPIGTYFNYSITEQLYTAEEIGMAGTISSISFYYMGIAAKDLPITVYMANVDAENLTSGISLAEADEVFDGTLSVPATAGWVTIDLDAPFAYDGTSNLLIGFIKGYLYYFSGQSWQGTATTTTMARYTQSDSAGPYTTSTVPSSSQANRPNIQMVITDDGSGSTCARPTGLAVETNALSAVFTWNSEATSFDVAHSMDATADPNDCIVGQASTNSYEFTNLELGNHYVWVRANCGSDGYSDWSSKKSFYIGYCVPAPSSVDNNGISNVTFGIGDYVVNNNTPKATYADYSNLVGTVQEGVETTIAITFETGYTYNTYVWVDLDNSLTFDSDEVVCYGESTNSNPTTLTLSFVIPTTQALGDFRLRIGSADSGMSSLLAANPCYTGTYACFQDYTLRVLEAPSCLAPIGVAVSDVTGHTATISWTSDATAWNIAYTPTGGEQQVVTVYENPYTLTGLVPNTEYEVGVQRFCDDGGYSILSNRVYFTTTVACPAPTVAVSNITTNTADVTCTNTDAELFNVMLGEDVVAESVPMPYTLNNLTTSTNYTVKVQAICGGEDGESAWSSGTTFMTAEECPDGMVCIGTGTTTNNYLPANNYYNYSLTEQIYTAAEIGMAGQISSIEFYKASTNAMNVNLNIYMVSTTKDEFTSTSDWIQVTAGDLVYSGTVTFVDNDWTNIELQSPFNYDGTSNLCIVVDNNTGSYESSTPFRVFTTEKNQAIYQYNDNDNYDPTAASIGTANSITTSKNRIRIAIGEPPACPKPTQLAVNYEGGTEATVTWNGEATSYNIDVNGTVTNNVTSPYQLTGLAMATTYEVKVQANCGSDLSEWTNAVSFTTDLCSPENQCELTFVLTDSYGDGWNGNAIQVKDVATGAIVGTLANENLDGTSGNETETQTVTLAVCDGRELEFSWVSGQYVSETSYTVTDVNNEVVVEGSGAGFAAFTYTVSCAVTDCRRPKNLAVTDIYGHSAMLNWTENGPATEWIVEVTPWGTPAPVLPYQWNTDFIPFEITGLQPETTYSVRVLPVCDVELWSDPITFTTDVACSAPRALTASDITSNSAVIYWEGEGESYTLRYRTISADEQLPATIILYAENVWDDGTGYQMLLDADHNTYGTIIPATGGLTTSGDASAEVYAEFEYKIPENADGSMTTTNVLIDQTISIQIPEGTYDWCITNPTPGDRIWIATSNGNIPGRYDDYEFEGGKTYEFHVYFGGQNDQVDLTITDGAKSGDAKDDEDDEDDEEWIAVMEDVVSPVTLNGLDPETRYVVQVRANCGEEDGYSEWTQTYFMTKGLCDVPNNLTATDIDADSATLNWNGIQNSFNVRYRTALQRNPVYFTNFNEGYDALHEEGWDWIGNIIYGLADPIYNIPANDNYFLQMGWATTEEAYIISPELPEYESGCILEYYAFAYNTNNTFQIGYSTNTQELEDFEWSEPIEANTNHYDSLYSEVLPDGVKYVAFKATAESQSSSIFLDNFGIFAADIPAGDWITVNNITATTLQIADLTPETEYEWQVQGRNRSCEANSEGTAGVTEWSALATFTTTPTCIVPTGLVYSNGELSWISNATSFDVEFEGQDVIEGVTNPYTPDLDPATIYYVRVRANCGEEDGMSDWTDYYGFVTDCGGAKDLPYAYDFEDIGEYYACWEALSFNTTNDVGLVEDESGNIVFRFSSYYNADDYSQILISPELNTETPVTVSFDYMTYNSTTETFYVGYATTTELTDLNAFTWSDPMEVNNNTEWATFTATYPAGTKHVAVLYYSNYMYYLYLDNFLFEEPASMEIVGYDEGEANWYLIASPIESDPANISGMTDGDYDLYRFNPAPSQEGEEWENSKIDTAFLLVAGQGYLYAHSTDITLVFDGTTENYDPVAVPLNYDATDNHKCWNLVGNPFTCEATIDMDYYVMNANGTGINPEPVLATTPIQPYTAVFVTATDVDQFVTFTAVEPTTDSTDAKGRLRIRLNENNHPANTAAVSISENKGSNSSMKNKELNTVNTKVNMSIDDKETYNMESYDKMPVNFKAEKNGVYTLNFTIENMTFGYLRLHDAATNTDVDLLANPEYTFKAKAGEDASRFFIEYKVK